MVRCGSCGEGSPEAHRFCSSCGAPLGSNPLVTADVATPRGGAHARQEILVEAADSFRRLYQLKRSSE